MSEPDPRVTLANERTYLSWIRTSLGLLAGAVAVHTPLVDVGRPVRVVLSVVLAGLAVTCVVQGWTRWRATDRAVRAGDPLPGFAGPTAVAVALAAVMVATVVVLVLG